MRNDDMAPSDQTADTYSRFNSWALSIITVLVLGSGGTALVFWRDISIIVAEINQRQQSSAVYVEDLRARVVQCEQKGRELDLELVRIKTRLGQ